MTTPTETEQGTPQPTAVSRREEALGKLPAKLQAALEIKKMERAVQAQIAGQSWGKALDVATRHAIADYCQKYGLDPATEIDVLGGRPYRNVSYYLRKLSDLVERGGVVEYAYPDHVGVDKRLEELAKGKDELAAKAKAEVERRLMARIENALPDAAGAAVVFRVKLRGMDREITGAKWAGGRQKDPVGDAYPVESAESRAARRCLRQIVHSVPVALGQQQQIEDAEWETVSGEVEDAVAEDARLKAEEDKDWHQVGAGEGGFRIKAGSGGGGTKQPVDPYGVGESVKAGPVSGSIADPYATDKLQRATQAAKDRIQKADGEKDEPKADEDLALDKKLKEQEGE